MGNSTFRRVLPKIDRHRIYVEDSCTTQKSVSKQKILSNMKEFYEYLCSCHTRSREDFLRPQTSRTLPLIEL